MFRPTLFAAALGAAFLAAGPARAANDADIAQLRAEFEQKLKALKDAYETRLKEMESRMARAEGQGGAAPAAAQTTAASGAGFNPEMSLILQGAFNKRKQGERHITGFFPAGEHAHAERGFTLDHTELVFTANVDPYFRGYANLAVADGEVEVEEAWFQTLGLGGGLTLKGGRFLSSIGYQNEQHPHMWDFADNNLMYSALFGEHLIQDGLQLKWVAPTPLFLELGAEVARGQFFPGSEAGGDKNGAGAWAAYAHVGGDVGVSNSWRAGLSYLRAKPKARHTHIEDLNDIEAHTDFSGTSKAWIADFVWKWAPNGNAKERNFKFQTEYFRRKESGQLLCEDNTADGGACSGLSDAFRSSQSGWYAQGVFQFMPRWRVGYRYDRLSPGSVDFGANNVFLPVSNYKPVKHSLMVDFSPSEFSRFRLQFARDRSMQGNPDNQVSVQYIHSLGPHGAHKF